MFKNIGGSYNSTYYYDDQPFYLTANAGVEWRVRKLRLAFDVYNILNRDYYVGSRTNVPQPQQSRHFLVKAAFDF